MTTQPLNHSSGPVSEPGHPSSAPVSEPVNPSSGPVVFAYDGSDLAKLAIDEAGRQLSPGRDALVLTVWHPFDVGFVPAGEVRFDAAEVSDVKHAAWNTAAEGASLAEGAGFAARSAAIEASPTWKGIVRIADERDSSLIVLGSHGRTGLSGVLIGSVAEAVAAHSRRPVLIVHRQDAPAHNTSQTKFDTEKVPA
jgi:nucleotide-binding universal stress UspA family protein